MDSLWKQACNMPNFGAQSQDIHTDILIIGGGIAGILCAYLLHQAGADYVLAETKTICSGITKNTTAKITSQHGLIYDKMIRRFGGNYAKLYLQANEEALDRYRTLCRNIDCDFEEKDAFVYSIDDGNTISKEYRALQKIGFPATMQSNLPLPFSVAGALMFPKQAQFHPLKFLSAISSKLNILEHTPVRELVGLTAHTDFGKIRANKIIVATHFPFLNKHGLYPIKLYQHRSYVIALENAPDVGGMYVDKDTKGLSFRNYRDLLLLGGGGHRTGKQGGAWQELLEFSKRNFPEATVKCQWATQDCMSLDGIPYIGRYSSGTDGLYVATGFNKWGMTTSMVAATILCNMVQGKKNPYASVFSPSRSILSPQLAVNGYETLTNLMTPSRRRCPHLGCALKWNKYEHTWDCPCHGSRFTESGKLIDNPATGDIKKM